MQFHHHFFRLFCALLLALVAGCLESQSLTCDDGTLCPADSFCRPGGGCGDLDVVGSCDGKAELTPCASADVTEGVCRNGLCVPVGCGNGAIETGEVCDDNNNNGGDGCSADCLSNETCGNSLVDQTRGEQCDDGNDIALDGCEKNCQTVPGQWIQRAASISPGVIAGPAMAYDSTRDRVVSFSSDGTTWEWDGSSWTQVTPSGSSPPPRNSHAMAYDAKRKRTLLFGGSGSVGLFRLNDTWEWDGQSWRQVLVAESPPARGGHTMSYDSARERILLFGGVDEDRLGDTWEWDGLAWTEVTPAIVTADNSPEPRNDHSMSYDPSRARVVLFGGHLGGLDRLGDTWEWDGLAWSNVTPASSPSPRSAHALVFDAENQKTLLFGGFSPNNQESWHWDGSTWNEVTPAQDNPAPRAHHGMVSDSSRGRVIMLGGNIVTDDETWSWDGASWAVAAQQPTPVDLIGHAASYDSVRGRLVLVGANSGNTGTSVTWEWDGHTWFDVTPAGDSPTVRIGHQMTYDSVRKRVVLFGGFFDSVRLDDTWEWDGTSWIEVTPLTAKPTPRAYHSMSFDAARNQLLLFGGINQANQNLNDTWFWDGVDWTEATPNDQPGIRAYHGAAYDRARQEIVVFGGFGLGDTWIWDGTNWREALSSVTPSPRLGAQLGYDPLTQRVVLYGGVGFADTWEWNGQSWSEVSPVGQSPGAQIFHTLTYSASRGRLVLFHGGSALEEPEIWEFSHRSVGPEVCHSGIDLDDDGLTGCQEDDCWGLCRPLCPPGELSCALDQPQCGDGNCNGFLESPRMCPEDCGPVVSLCGDFLCDADESSAACPGDCP